MKAKRIWYVVMNSHQARILQGLPHRHEPLPHETVLEAPLRSLGDILSDKPTSSFSSGSGGRRSAVEPGSDPQRQDAMNFLDEVFAYLEPRRKDHAFDEIVLIAAPDILGLWRVRAPKALQSVIVREVAKNLVQTPLHDLGAMIETLAEG